MQTPKLIITYKVPNINLVNVGGNNTCYSDVLNNILSMSGNYAFIQFYVTDAVPNHSYIVNI